MDDQEPQGEAQAQEQLREAQRRAARSLHRSATLQMWTAGCMLVPYVIGALVVIGIIVWVLASD